jgi:NADH:ubiquinone oxidoreductase subunit 6 (subunit J)
MTIITLALMGFTLAAAVMAVHARNILHAVLSLALALIGLSGLFLVLGNPFIAAMEILIYVGGISVMMIFAVMLSQSIAAETEDEGNARRYLALLPAAGFFAVAAIAILQADLGSVPAAGNDSALGNIEEIGRSLLTTYALSFELLSVVLLLAIVGAVTVARSQGRDGEAATGAEGSDSAEGDAT